MVALLGARTLAEQRRSRDRQRLRERFEAAVHRLLDEHALGQHLAVLVGRGGARKVELVGVAWLGEEPEDLAVVDGARAVVDGARRGRGVGIPGEQHAHRQRRDAPGLAQEARAVHAGHAHVRDHDRIAVPVPLELLQRVRAAGGDPHVEAA